ncbi:uncharacterized protein [Nothobranchius furzeri]|uniref:uncharacterized protein n=1 Tax=Nothobranchius furzeri TaxID=105023 RepID=UPI003904C427
MQYLVVLNYFGNELGDFSIMRGHSKSMITFLLFQVRIETFAELLKAQHNLKTGIRRTSEHQTPKSQAVQCPTRDRPRYSILPPPLQCCLLPLKLPWGVMRLRELTLDLMGLLGGLAAYLVDLHEVSHLTELQVNEVIQLCKGLPEEDKDLVDSFKSEVTPDVESVERSLSDRPGGPAQWPGSSRLFQALCVRLCTRRPPRRLEFPPTGGLKSLWTTITSGT